MTNKPTYEELEKQVKELHNESLVLREEKKTIQEQLNLSKIILSATQDLLVLKDCDFVYQVVNPAFCKFLGKTEGSIIGKTDFDLFPRFEAAMYRRDDLKVIKTGKPQVQDEEVTGEDEKRWLRVAKTPVLSEKGASIGVLYSVVDITNRKRSEESLARAEHEKETILDSLLEIVVYMDLEMRILWANIAACKSVNLTRDELIGRHCFELWADSSEPCSDCVVVRAIKTGQAQEIKKTTPDGRSWFNIGCPVRDEKNTIVGGIEVVLEITERKKAEEALRESEGKLNAMLQSIGDHMSMMDKDLNIIWTNKTAKEIFGNDVIGKKCYETYHQRKDPCEPYPCITLKAFQDGKIHEHDTQVIDKDGKKIFFHCTANVALKDKEGKPTAVLEISRDTTEHKQAELVLIERGKELENKTHELEEVNAALRVLLKHRDEDKKDLEDKVVANVKELVFPYVEKLNNSRLNDRQMVYLNIIKSNLEDIITPFLHQLSSKYSVLTPNEIQVAGFVKEGKTTKEIAELLNSSTGTIDFHRNNLRKKLGLRNTKTNLRSFLLHLT
jgi:PAS domain S-box-containing protein